MGADEVAEASSDAVGMRVRSTCDQPGGDFTWAKLQGVFGGEDSIWPEGFDPETAGAINN